MSSSLSPYSAQAILAYVLDQTALSPPAAWWVQAHTADPGSSGLLNAIDKPRQSVTWADVTGGVALNANSPTWMDVPGVTVTHWSLWDAESGGNCWLVGAVSPQVIVTAGSALQAQPGDLTVTLATWTGG